MMDLDPAAIEATGEVLRELRRGIHTHDFEYQARAAYPIIAEAVARATADAIADDLEQKAASTAHYSVTAWRHGILFAADLARSFGRTPETDTTEATE